MTTCKAQSYEFYNRVKASFVQIWWIIRDTEVGKKSKISAHHLKNYAR